jgi:hypothetical protein
MVRSKTVEADKLDYELVLLQKLGCTISNIIATPKQMNMQESRKGKRRGGRSDATFNVDFTIVYREPRANEGETK